MKDLVFDGATLRPEAKGAYLARKTVEAKEQFDKREAQRLAKKVNAYAVSSTLSSFCPSQKSLNRFFSLLPQVTANNSWKRERDTHTHSKKQMGSCR